MSAYTLTEFESLTSCNFDLTFQDVGDAIQHIVDELLDELFPGSAVNNARLRSVWVPHPNRQGEKRRHRCIITFHRFSMRHFFVQIINELFAGSSNSPVTEPPLC